jgi:ectoine hydroxylase-related dioxygenase (phytanoyl-CoA dioxygenase family)
VLREDIARAIGALSGWPGVRIMSDNVLWKPPGARPLGFHQDNAYLAWFRPQELMSCWIALDDTTAEGGTMELVRGSHRWAHAPLEGEFHGPSDYRKYMERAAAGEGLSPRPAAQPCIARHVVGSAVRARPPGRGHWPDLRTL